MTDTRTLDWRSEHDERSRRFPIRTAEQRTPLRSYTWGCEAWLDQGRQGACVGFSWTHEMAAKPVVVQAAGPSLAQAVYTRARELDDWPGEDYSGTSVLAGAKAVIEWGAMGGYRWAFNVDDLAWGIGHQGPAVLGINWHESMWQTNADGLVEVAGDVVGGHAILCRGVSLPRRLFRLRNSWGRPWGDGNGDCLVSFDGMAALLASNGEACFPIRRHQRKATA